MYVGYRFHNCCHQKFCHQQASCGSQTVIFKIFIKKNANFLEFSRFLQVLGYFGFYIRDWLDWALRKCSIVTNKRLHMALFTRRKKILRNKIANNLSTKYILKY